MLHTNARLRDGIAKLESDIAGMSPDKIKHHMFHMLRDSLMLSKHDVDMKGAPIIKTAVGSMPTWNQVTTLVQNKIVFSI